MTDFINTIPRELLPEDQVAARETLTELWKRCATEYTDTEYARRTHFSHKTYQAGCRGPLCVTASRQAARRNSGSAPREDLVWLEPIIEFFFAELNRLHDLSTEAMRAAIIQGVALEAS